MKIIISLFLFFMFVCESPGKTVTLKKEEITRLKAYGIFYSKPTGSVAFLPKVGDTRYLENVITHDLLPGSGFYKLPRKGNYFFRVNHHADSEEVSYLAVIAYIIYPGNFDHRNPLHLTRNIADWKPGEEGRKLVYSFIKTFTIMVKVVMITLFKGKAGHGTENETSTLGADGRATARAGKPGGFADSLKASS